MQSARPSTASTKQKLCAPVHALVHQFWEDLGVTRETLFVGSPSAGWVSVHAMIELSGAEVWSGVSSHAQLPML